MSPNDRNSNARASGVLKLCLAGAFGLAMLALQACTSDMPQPHYPIYMQDRPAEAVQTPQQAGDGTSVAPGVVPQGNKGGVSATDLPPPPPPPPPPSSSSSSSSSATVAPVKETRAAYVYVLQAHDTLYGVSRRFGVPVKALYEINGLAPDAALRVGQRILLPETAVDKGPEEHASGPTMVKLATALSRPSTPVVTPAKPVTKPTVSAPVATVTTTTTTTTTKPVVTKPSVAALSSASSSSSAQASVTAPPATTGFPSNTQLSQMGRGLFVWPVRGKILVPFGQLAPNVRNDGINIAADSGADVRAASDGVVVYEGDQVKELGNTVYIKHANGWYTGYSHLSVMGVKNNEHVTKGEIIGKVGQTGVIDRPQLHFEIRFTPSTDIARPIDPSLVLP